MNQKKPVCIVHTEHHFQMLSGLVASELNSQLQLRLQDTLT